MDKQVDFSPGTVVSDGFLDRIQEHVSPLAMNCGLVISGTTIQIPAAADDGAAALGIQGHMRYMESVISVSFTGGDTAGTYGLWAVTSANDGDATFSLAKVLGSGTPAGFAFFRKLGTVAWSGSALSALVQITGIPSAGSVGYNQLSGDQRWEPGDLKTTARATAATGWLVCDGSLVSTSTYAALFNEIGHTYNGGADPGGGNFRIPDYRDRTLVGVSGSKVRGATGGAETVQLTAAESGVPAHTHATDAGGSHSHIPISPSTGFLTRVVGGGSDYTLATTGSVEIRERSTTEVAGNHAHNVNANTAAAASAAHNNLPPYQASYVHIKT